ncbi:MAG: hypothetical protein ACLRFM_00520 [Alphaproteobacteria bacterium]
MYYKNAFFYFVKIFCAIIVFMIAMIYVSDPYMIFHKKLWRHNRFYSDFRVQDYGLIKFMDFDNLILGSSMLENTSARVANEKLGGKWINLSFGAQRSFERFAIINWTMKNHDLQNVIVSMDDHSFAPHRTEGGFDVNLYNDDFFAKWKTYFKTNALTCVFFGKHCSMPETDVFDRPSAWIEYYRHRFGGFENWIAAEHNDTQIQDVFRMLLENDTHCDLNNQDYKKTIDTEILPLFENQKTKFHLIIPPYSGIYWAYDFKKFDCRMRPYKYLIEQTDGYKNVVVYWLYDEDYVFDITKYKDLTHYTDAMNSMQLDVVKNRSHVINVQNYDAKIQKFKTRVSKINMDAYVRRIRDYYDAKK